MKHGDSQWREQWCCGEICRTELSFGSFIWSDFIVGSQYAMQFLKRCSKLRFALDQNQYEREPNLRVGHNRSWKLKSDWTAHHVLFKEITSNWQQDKESLSRGGEETCKLSNPQIWEEIKVYSDTGLPRTIMTRLVYGYKIPRADL